MLALALAPAGLAAWGFGLPWARDYVKHGVKIEIEEALARRAEGRARSGLKAVADKVRSAVGAVFAGEIRVRLRVRNTTVLPARIQGARYRVRIGGHAIGAGEWTAPGGAQWFPPGRDVVILAVLDPDWSALAGAGFDGALGRDTPVSVHGELRVALWSHGFPIPFEVSHIGWTRQAER